MGLVLVAFDGSEPSRRALDWAVRRARQTGDELVLLNVIPASVANTSLARMMPAGIELPSPLAKTFEANARERLEEAIRGHAPTGVRMRAELLGGDAAEVIVRAATEWRVDEVVMGRKSYESHETKLGPIAERLVRDLPATVTVVR